MNKIFIFLFIFMLPVTHNESLTQMSGGGKIKIVKSMFGKTQIFQYRQKSIFFYFKGDVYG